MKIADAGAGGYRLSFGSALSGRFAQQFLSSDFPDLTRGIADDDCSRGNVSDDDGPGTDEGLLADLDRRAEHGGASDPCSPADGRASSAARAGDPCAP